MKDSNQSEIGLHNPYRNSNSDKVVHTVHIHIGLNSEHVSCQNKYSRIRTPTKFLKTKEKVSKYASDLLAEEWQVLTAAPRAMLSW